MAVVRPFRGLRYDPRHARLSDVIVPPYDVVADDERGDLYDRDPHNAVRLELTRDAGEEAETDYAHVSRTLYAWQQGGVLARDPAPAFYGLRQEFEAPDGARLARDGFFCELRLEDYSARVVLPHERTLAGPKADRLKVMRACGATLSPIFALYEDRHDALGAVLAAAIDSGSRSSGSGLAGGVAEAAGVMNTLAPIIDPEPLVRIAEFIADRPLVIADGHHRYETCLAYRDERRRASGSVVVGDAPYESALVYLANAFAPGSLLLPIHRVIRKGGAPTESAWRELDSGWSSKVVDLPPDAASAMQAVLAEHLQPLAGHPAFAADDASGTLRVFWREEPLGDALMVELLEEQVLGGVFDLDPDAIRDGAVGFPKSASRAAQDVRGGEGTVALYLNPVMPEDVFRVTEAGRVMPQKSTFFAPKIPTGLVFRVEDQPPPRSARSGSGAGS